MVHLGPIFVVVYLVVFCNCDIENAKIGQDEMGNLRVTTDDKAKMYVNNQEVVLMSPFDTFKLSTEEKLAALAHDITNSSQTTLQQAVAYTDYRLQEVTDDRTFLHILGDFNMESATNECELVYGNLAKALYVGLTDNRSTDVPSSFVTTGTCLGLVYYYRKADNEYGVWVGHNEDCNHARSRELGYWPYLVEQTTQTTNPLIWQQLGYIVCVQ